MPKASPTLPMRAMVTATVLLFVALISIFLIVPAFFDVHITDALFEQPPPPWQLAPEAQAKLQMTDLEMRGLYEFKQYCASCHGTYGEGGGAQAARVGGVPKLIGEGTALRNGLSREGLLKTLNEGVPGSAMPSFVHIADPVKDSIIAYMLYAQNNEDRLLDLPDGRSR